MKKLKCFIAEQLEKTEIFEMARSLSRYKEDIINVMPIILAHCILVKLAHKENSTEFVDHWKHEIKGFFSKVIGVHLKTSNSYSSRYKYAHSVLIDEFEFDNEDIFYKKVANKIFNEGYDWENIEDVNLIKRTISEFINDGKLDEIIHLIANDNFEAISIWVKRL